MTTPYETPDEAASALAFASCNSLEEALERCPELLTTITGMLRSLGASQNRKPTKSSPIWDPPANPAASLNIDKLSNALIKRATVGMLTREDVEIFDSKVPCALPVCNLAFYLDGNALLNHGFLKQTLLSIMLWQVAAEKKGTIRLFVFLEREGAVQTLITPGMKREEWEPALNGLLSLSAPGDSPRYSPAEMLAALNGVLQAGLTPLNARRQRQKISGTHFLLITDAKGFREGKDALSELNKNSWNRNPPALRYTIEMLLVGADETEAEMVALKEEYPSLRFAGDPTLIQPKINQAIIPRIRTLGSLTPVPI